MKCQACQSQVKDWQGSDSICFLSGDNWNCETLNMLRDLVYEGQKLPPEINYQYCEDMKYATVNVSHIDDLDGALALWVCWYKNRGRTDNYLLLFSVQPAKAPTEKEILKIVVYYIG